MEDEACPRAKTRVEALKGFTSHPGVFIFVNALLLTILPAQGF